MKILVINCGSSSLKYKLFYIKDYENKEYTVLAKGLVDKIGLPGSTLKHYYNENEFIEISQDVPNHKTAVEMMLDALLDKDYGVLKDVSEIAAVGHRVLHGGEKFSDPVIITREVMEVLKECIEMAPLHNPPNIVGIKATRQLLPDTPMVAVFDTAFHQTMPEHAYIYGIPYDLYEKYHIRRYGFHGTSHRYVSLKTAEFLKRPLEELKLVTLHLGNGASVSAVKYGKSIENSMGFTPLGGMVMGTRCGNIDPAIIPYIMEKENIPVDEITDFLNKKCGVLGISGNYSDFRDLEQSALAGDHRAQLSLKIFAYQAKKYIGSYTAVMNGLDAIVFTGGIGENSITVRKLICRNMDYFGIKIDEEKNNIRGVEADITAKDAKTKVLIIPTNEELMIALDTVSLIK